MYNKHWKLDATAYGKGCLSMKIGLIGLGKMGFHLGLNMIDHHHEVIAYDVVPESVTRFAEVGKSGAAGVESYASLVAALPQPRVIWVMVPSQVVDDVLGELKNLLAPGDIVIEGGNSHYKETLRRAANLKTVGVHYVDVGTSGGTEGARHGACYMIGADPGVFSHIEVLFRDTAVPNGYLYTGRTGSGHFAKMVHNGIEYGMMAAIAEGFEVLDASEFEYDYAAIAKVWSNGSVIRGWLMELAQNAFQADPKLADIKGVMHSSGEGLWTVEEALHQQIPTPVIAMSLMMRYRSQQDDTFNGKVVAALRNQFGGHAVEKA